MAGLGRVEEMLHHPYFPSASRSNAQHHDLLRFRSVDGNNDNVYRLDPVKDLVPMRIDKEQEYPRAVP